MIRITSNSKQYLKELAKVEKGLERCAARTLTATAQAVTTRSERNIRRDMIVRGTYTTKSLKTYKAGETKPLAKMNSVAGTISDYLPVHDKGGKVKARKKRIAVPTNKVRGKNRKRRVPTRYRLDKMSGAFILRQNGGKLKRPGMFIRTGKKKIIKVRDLGASSYTLKARNWHTEAVKRYGNYAFMADEYARQARRLLGHASK